MSLRPPSDPPVIVRDDTNEPRSISICLACGDALSPALERSASLRCHDCRDAAALIRPELLSRMPVRLRARLRLRRAA